MKSELNTASKTETLKRDTAEAEPVSISELEFVEQEVVSLSFDDVEPVESVREKSPPPPPVRTKKETSLTNAEALHHADESILLKVDSQRGKRAPTSKVDLHDSIVPVAFTDEPTPAAVQIPKSVPVPRLESQTARNNNKNYTTIALVAAALVGGYTIARIQSTTPQQASAPSDVAVTTPAAETPSSLPEQAPSVQVQNPTPKPSVEPETLVAPAAPSVKPAINVSTDNKTTLLQPKATSATPSAAAQQPEVAKEETAAAPPPPPPPVIEGSGEFNASAASTAIGSASGRASSCRGEDGPSGVARVTITFAPSGRVTTARVEGPPYAGTPIGGCIASALRSASVPPFEGAPVTVSKTITIR